MATTSQSSIGWRLFGVMCFVLLLSMGYNGWQWALHQKDRSTIRNYYNKTVRDSIRWVVPPKVAPVRSAAPIVIYRTLPVSPAQLAAIKQALTVDFTKQLRQELARVAPRPTTVTLKQQPMVLALKDTMVVRHKPGTNQLTVSAQKTGSFQDKWLSLNTTIRPGKSGRPDSLEVKYQIRNEYDVAAWVKRPKHKFWPFGKRRIYVTLVSKNPNAKDSDLSSIPVNKAKKIKK